MSVVRVEMRATEAAVADVTWRHTGDLMARQVALVVRSDDLEVVILGTAGEIQEYADRISRAANPPSA